MELDWGTFLLEIVNFLILAWILKRFLYRPVMASIAERRKRIEGSLTDAGKMREEALAMKAAEEEKLAEWKMQKQSLESGLIQEISSRRERLLEDLNAEIEKENSRIAAIEARKLQEWRRDMEERALDTGATFASRLLGRLASPELDARIFDVLMEDLKQFDATQMRASLKQGDSELDVTSAYPLSPENRKLLVETMETLADRPLKASFSENPALLGGMRVGIGSWVIHASLADELAFFRKAPNDAA